MQWLKKIVGVLLCVWVALQDATPIKLLDWIGRFTVARDISQFLREWAIMPSTPVSIIISIAMLIVGISLLLPSSIWQWPKNIVGKTEDRYNFVPAILFGIIGFGLLAVILGAKVLYDRGFTEIHHPVVTYLPEDDVSAPRTVTSGRPIPTQSLSQPQLISRAFHEVYKCRYHWPVPATPKERAEGLAKVKAASKTMESVFGVSIKVLTTDDSVGMELTPVDPTNIRVFGGMVKKLTEVVRYLNDDYVIITITYDAPGLLGQIFSLMPPPDTPGARDQQRKLAASFLQIDDDKCELL